MAMTNENQRIYKVVVNHEPQYSIWPVDRGNPWGWRDAGKEGPKSECLKYIQEVECAAIGYAVIFDSPCGGAIPWRGWPVDLV
ncbi:MbtH family protein [Limnothrix sp. FACHB-1083]|uniref:MbtH family protein n=2 Tax=unclassified Limnothrix TaxID=2632864 RepID=UPI001680B2A8|nr:MbtH family protein [Limnothrix sp. FACHB-1083]MBD2191641.1 MbtH family protein [Limnothrix sp. FACHB-1088]